MYPQSEKASALRSFCREKVVPVLLLVAALPGCTTFEGFMDRHQAPRTTTTVPLSERAELEPISRNFFVLGSDAQAVVGEPQIVFAREEDTFSDLAREYGLGYDELVDANPGIDPWLPGDGTPVLLPTQYVLPDVPRRGVVLNIASKRLFYFPAVAEGEPIQVMTYPIGIGRVGWETPLGDTTVVSKARDPHWFVPASVRKEHADAGDPLPSVVPPGPDNPLGKFVLKLNMPGYLIHGTNQPYGVGMRVSHGCVRLYPENIELLYSLVDVGESVTIINRPFLAGWRDGELFFEGHTPLDEDTTGVAEHIEEALASVGADSTPVDMDVVRAAASTIAADGRGVPVRILRRDVDEIYERARVVRNTVRPDPDVPTLAEIRTILDAPADEQDDGESSGE